MTETSPAAAQSSRKAIWGWCLFDWANSPFPTLITTFVFSTYFSKAVAATPEEGTALWGWMVGIAGVVIAILAPLCGAVVDRYGPRKPGLVLFSLLCIAGSAALWFVQPDESSVPLALGAVAVATIGFEMGMVFYNAMLPSVAPRKSIGRISGWAWGLGYAGGLTALVATLLLFVQTDHPLGGLDKDSAEHIRISGPLVALWFTLFAVPLLLWVPDQRKQSPLSSSLRHAFHDLAHLWRTLRSHPAVGRFLLARMIYTDGLNTLFAFGGMYAAGTFGMSFDQVIILGIAMNVSAGVGAAVFGWVDDRIGAKATVIIALVSMTALCIGLLVVDNPTLFWALAIPLGIFFGPAQSASRSLLARIAPPEAQTEMFGLFALSGKITSFAGPLVLAAVITATDSQRWGMSTILVFLIVGLVMMFGLRTEETDDRQGH